MDSEERPGSRDITNLLDDYRECVRHLWNAYLRYLETPESLENTKDRFDLIDRALFATMVLVPLGYEDTVTGLRQVHYPDPIPFIRIIPNSEQTPVMINRSREWSGYWDHPVTTIGVNADLQFVSCFDFDVYGFRNFKYYLVLIAAADAAYDEVIGRYALVSTEYARVFYVENTT